MSRKKQSKKKSLKKRPLRSPHFKSKLEKHFASLLIKHGLSADYEATTFQFAKIGHYTPDWRISPTLYVETKGYFSPANRGNLLSFREQHPDVEIFLVFSAPSNRLTSKSKTTYSAWADKHGFRWSGIDDVPFNDLFKSNKETK